MINRLIMIEGPVHAPPPALVLFIKVLILSFGKDFILADIGCFTVQSEASIIKMQYPYSISITVLKVLSSGSHRLLHRFRRRFL